jgi:hypothetical protein
MANTELLMDGSAPPMRLLDQVRDAIRLKHYSYRTEQSYVQWIRKYILFHNKRHPNEMGVPESDRRCGPMVPWSVRAGAGVGGDRPGGWRCFS